MIGLGKRCDRCSEERGSKAGMVTVWLGRREKGIWGRKRA